MAAEMAAKGVDRRDRRISREALWTAAASAAAFDLATPRNTRRGTSHHLRLNTTGPRIFANNTS
jgi:hypothetical protein